MKWQPIETAPKDGTPVILRFKAGRHTARSGTKRSRIYLDERVVTGKWWSREMVVRAVGRKANLPPRVGLLNNFGGYWASAGLHSQPMVGQPSEWMTLAPQGDVIQ